MDDSGKICGNVADDDNYLSKQPDSARVVEQIVEEVSSVFDIEEIPSFDALNEEFSGNPKDIKIYLQSSNIPISSTGTTESKSNNEKPTANGSQETLQSRKSGLEFCRICHDMNGLENFISPCNCKGTLSLVHKSCLERWLGESDSNHCELCGYEYVTKRFPKYSLLMSVLAWMTVRTNWRERRSLMMDLVVLMIVFPVIFVATVLALQLLDELFLEEAKRDKGNNINIAEQYTKYSIKMGFLSLGNVMSKIGQLGIISMIITMDMAFLSWLALRLQYHLTLWYSWYRRNCKVVLVTNSEVDSSNRQQTSRSAELV